jgi:hypothetical protein
MRYMKQSSHYHPATYSWSNQEDKLNISVPTQSFEVNVPRQSPDLVWKNPGEHVSHRPLKVELVIHPAAHVHVFSEVQVPCSHSQPIISSEDQATHL